MHASAPHGDLHPIGVVAKRTGLTQDVLRVWERRYGAIEPLRERAGSRRLYSSEQIERLVLLKRCVESGWRIGDVANRTRAELLGLVGDGKQGQESRNPSSASPSGEGLDALLSEAMAAVLVLDADRLRVAMLEATIQLGARAFRSDLILPLLEEIGDRWREGTLRPAHEHLATTTVRSFLEGMRDGAPRPGAPRLLVGTPAGQRHEIGALMVAAAADELGWEVVYLGPDLPVEDIAAAARQLEVRCVALSLVYVEAEVRLLEDLRKLRGALPKPVPVLVGGRAALALRANLERSGMECPGDLRAFQTRLESLHAFA